ncbi:MAG TPA: hypothetical protein VK616_19125 [Flavitalea sp.]|nr:hypothetical protein [Flavitalea sp.]
MLDDLEEFNSLIFTVTELAKADQETQLTEILLNAQLSISQTDFDNWNGGMYGYTVYASIDVKTFVSIRNRVEELERLLMEKFHLAMRHRENELISRVTIVPKAYTISKPFPNPHRPFSASEVKRRNELIAYLDRATEDELIEEILLPLFRQLGFHRITSAGHKDKTLEYGKDIWMKFALPTQHLIYFGVQVKKGKIDASGTSKSQHANISEIHNQITMMLGHEIFDPEIGKRVLVDHAFIVAGSEITKAARNWIGGRLDVSKRSQILFMDRDDIVNLFVVTNLPLPSTAVIHIKPDDDDLPF